MNGTTAWPQEFRVPRFWVSSDADIPDTDNGFFPDPEGEWSVYYSADGKTLKGLDDHRCLVLLGEPGSGKSTALLEEFDRVKELEGQEALFLHLGGTQEEGELRSQIFESDEYLRWKSGSGHLRLLLDSLDEARLRVETVASVIRNGLKGVDVNRLKLRITCRSAERHKPLEAFLKSIFGDRNFDTLSIAPLRRLDVEELAHASNVDAQGFVSSCLKEGLQPLAVIPLTLSMLLRTVQTKNEIPVSRIEAYESGLRLLTEEPDTDRKQGTKAGGRLNSGQRFSVAVRVAAALRLSGRTFISEDPLQASPETALLGDLAGGKEQNYTTAGDSTFSIEEEEVREALSTAAFTPSRNGTTTLSHEYFGDFLTARWLAGADLTIDQALDLLTVAMPNGSFSIAPQLKEVATWLCGMWPIFRDHTITAEPAIALRSELSGASAQQKQALVRELLKMAQAGPVDYYDRSFRSGIGNLNHPGLHSQLEPWLQDQNANLQGREAACEIARACGVSSLESTLVSVAMEPNEAVSLRVHALRALEEFAVPASWTKMTTLATSSLDEDLEDEIKGTAFRNVWPRLLTCSKALGVLTEPKRRNLLGAYKSFLWGDFVNGLEDSDLPRALRWASQLPTRHHPMGALNEVREELLVRAWPLVGKNAATTRAYANVVYALRSDYQDLLDQTRRNRHPEVLVEPEGRRALIQELIGSVTAKEIVPVAVASMGTTPLLNDDDFDWLVTKLVATIGRKNELGWAHLVSQVGMGTRDHDIMELCERSPKLLEIAGPRFEAVPVDSSIVQMERDHQEFVRKQEERKRAEDAERVRAIEWAELAISNLQITKPEEFYKAIYHLEHCPFRNSTSWSVSDLRELDGWSHLADPQRAKLIDFAPSYLRRVEVPPSTWFFTNRTSWIDWAAYRAFRLLYDVDRSTAEKLPKRVWAKWVLIMVDWHGQSDAETDFNNWMLRQAKDRCPAELSDAFDKQMRRDSSKGHLHSERLDTSWTPLLETRAANRAKSSRLPVDRRAQIIRVLLRNESLAGERLARNLVSVTALRAGSSRRELAVQAAAALATTTRDGSWNHIYPLMKRFPKFGRELISDLAQHRHEAWASRLEPAEAKELFDFTLRNYPFREDPQLDDGVGAYPPRAQIADWRNDIVRILEATGSRESVAALKAISDDHPKMLGFKRTVRDAEEAMMAQQWTPPTPGGVIEMSVDKSRRWMRTDEELRDATLAALRRAELKLQGTSPQAHLLWNESPIVPKPENAFSDWLKAFLSSDLKGRGILVDREVEVRNPPGHKGMGDSPDLLIQAIAGELVEGSPVISVTIEVKGCWNPQVLTAIETQLANKYLADDHQFGIYLVASFQCDDWDESDYRKRDSHKFQPGELRTKLTEQAANISRRKNVEISTVLVDCSLPDR